MTKDEYLVWRKNWGGEYQAIVIAIQEAKLQVRRRNSYWAQLPTDLCKLNLATARSNLKHLRYVMIVHQRKLDSVRRENNARYNAQREGEQPNV